MKNPYNRQRSTGYHRSRYLRVRLAGIWIDVDTELTVDCTRKVLLGVVNVQVSSAAWSVVQDTSAMVSVKVTSDEHMIMLSSSTSSLSRSLALQYRFGTGDP